MSVKFYIPQVANANDKCPICLDPLNDEIIVAHPGGEQHPLHRRCMLVWGREQSACPICRVDADIEALRQLTTLKERVIQHMHSACSSATPYLCTDSIILVSTVTARTFVC